PRTRVPERDVPEELLPGRPAGAAAVMADDPEDQEHAEDEQAEAPFRKPCTKCHDIRPCSRPRLICWIAARPAPPFAKVRHWTFSMSPGFQLLSIAASVGP